MVGFLAPIGCWVGQHKAGLLIGSGIGLGIGSTVWACIATVKAGDILDKHNAEMEKIEQAKEIADEGEYTEKDIKHDRLVIWGNTIASFGKLYAGPAICMGAGIGCILGGTKILSAKYGMAMAALGVTEELFSNYRGRVIDDQGVEKDQEYLTGRKIERKTVTEEITDPETGKTKKQKVEEEYIDINIKDTAFWIKVFGEYNPNGSKNNEWDHNIDLCLYSLRAKQNCWNEQFQRNETKIYLNDVLKDLGFVNNNGADKKIDDTAGQLYGWTWAPGKYIDFGLGDYSDDQVRRFINGETDCLILTFNIDGIYNDDGVLLAPTPIIGA